MLLARELLRLGLDARTLATQALLAHLASRLLLSALLLLLHESRLLLLLDLATLAIRARLFERDALVALALLFETLALEALLSLALRERSFLGLLALDASQRLGDLALPLSESRLPLAVLDALELDGLQGLAVGSRQLVRVAVVVRWLRLVVLLRRRNGQRRSRWRTAPAPSASCRHCSASCRS